MDGDTDYLCKLCLVRQEDRSEEELRGVDDVEINLFGFDIRSPGGRRFNKLCTLCHEKIESALRLRKQIKFMAEFWNKFTQEDEKKQEDAANSITLHCHLCSSCFRNDRLLEHIITTHGSTHLPNCSFCRTLLTTCQTSAAEGTSVEVLAADCSEDNVSIQNYSELHEATMETSVNESAEVEEAANKKRTPTKRRRLACSLCDATFHRKVQLDAHLIESHGTTDPLYDSEEILLLNFTADTAAGETSLQPFPCHLCAKSYSRKDKLKHHLRKLHQVMKVPRLNVLSTYTCHICDKTYRSQSTFDKHLLEHSPTPFQCFICMEAFAGRGERRIHENSCLKLACAGNGRYKCLACSESTQSFNSAESLKEHMKHCAKEAGDNKCHVCVDCGGAFARAHHLAIHKERVHGQIMTCLKCGKIFSDRSMLKRHFDRMHNFKQSVICTVCGQKLSRPDKLIEHMRLHTGFPCNVCKKVLNTRREYIDHKKLHK